VWVGKIALFDKTLALLIFALLGIVKQACLCTRLPQKLVLALACGACQCAKCALGVSSCCFVSNQGKSVNRSGFVTLLQVVGSCLRWGVNRQQRHRMLNFY